MINDRITKLNDCKQNKPYTLSNALSDILFDLIT